MIFIGIQLLIFLESLPCVIYVCIHYYLLRLSFLLVCKMWHFWGVQLWNMLNFFKHMHPSTRKLKGNRTLDHTPPSATSVPLKHWLVPGGMVRYAIMFPMGDELFEFGNSLLFFLSCWTSSVYVIHPGLWNADLSFKWCKWNQLLNKSWQL